MTSRRFRHFLMLVGLGASITVGTGFVHGRLTQRWGPVPDVEAAAKHLLTLPAEIAQWTLVSNEPIDEPTLRMLSCAGYVHRKYVNRQSGHVVSIVMIVGPPGPTAVHTPEICFSSRDYAIHEPRERVTLSDKKGQPHSFWSLSFRSNNPSMDQLRVCYAWRARDSWSASKSPRFEFGGERMLFKLQASSLVPVRTGENAADPCQQFLAAMLQSGWNLKIAEQ